MIILWPIKISLNSVNINFQTSNRSIRVLFFKFFSDEIPVLRTQKFVPSNENTVILFIPCSQKSHNVPPPAQAAFPHVLMMEMTKANINPHMILAPESQRILCGKSRFQFYYPLFE